MSNVTPGDDDKKSDKPEQGRSVRKVVGSAIDTFISAVINALVPVAVGAILTLFGFGCPKPQPVPAVPPQAVVVPQDGGGQPATGE